MDETSATANHRTHTTTAIGVLTEALDSMREGIQVLSPSWRYLYLNRAAALHGRKQLGELLGKSMLDCYPGIERTPAFTVLERCMKGRTEETLENEFEYEDGARASFELRIRPCPEGVIILSLDVSERKRIEASLRHAEKLHALGSMAAGVAHDLKNILNPIALGLRRMRRSLVASEEAARESATVERALRAGVETVERLRQFSRNEPEGPPESVDLNRVAETATAICTSKTRELSGIDVRSELQETPSVLARSSEVLSAVVNLLLNALDAIGQTGTIAVRTGSDGASAWIEVEDDGPGFSADAQEHLFEPFFTTKERGTGLGLAAVQGLARRHGGRVALATDPESGTTIRLSFPAQASATMNDAPPIRSEWLPASRAVRLLVVEDDPIAREAMQVLLSEEGFRVETAADGDAALALVRTGSFDALVCDVHLPRMSGADVVRLARARGAHLPVVLMSGVDASDRAVAELLREPHTAHLGKPVDIERLIELLRRMHRSQSADAHGS